MHCPSTVVSPAVVTAANRFAIHHARVQRHLPMGAAVFEREHVAALGARQHDRIAREASPHASCRASLPSTTPADTSSRGGSARAPQVPHADITGQWLRRRHGGWGRLHRHGWIDGTAVKRGLGIHAWRLRGAKDWQEANESTPLRPPGMSAFLRRYPTPPRLRATCCGAATAPDTPMARFPCPRVATGRQGGEKWPKSMYP